MIGKELEALAERMLTLGPKRGFESLGVTDHDGIRTFTTAYGIAISDTMLEAERTERAHLVEHLAAALGAGLLLGMAYAQKKEETETHTWKWEV